MKIKDKINCKKKKYTRKQVILFLNKLKKNGYNKAPWRNEVAYYKCDDCKTYHTSSVLGKESKTLLKGKTYFEHQKDKWSNFLQNYSSKKARL